MSRSWTGVVFLALFALGCGDDEETAARISEEDPFGGQTGSLVPPRCGLAVNDGESLTIPASEGAFIVQAEDCSDLSQGDVVVTRSDGESVPIELVPLGDGRYLARAGTGLQAGEYAVSIDGAAAESVDLQVTDAPPPGQLGVLRQTGEPSCNAEFVLELDAAVVPYAALLRLQASFDFRRDYVWIDYGLVAAEGGEVALVMECGCIDDGSHYLELSAEIAGSSVQLEPVGLEFQVRCPRGRGSSCAFHARNSRVPNGAAGFAAVCGLGLLARRRRGGMKVRRGDS